MKQLLIACETLRDEVELALKKTKTEIEISWMPNRLHDRPEQLKNALQEEINRVENDYNILLFAYGNCGNGLLGIKSEKATMIIPKYDDCIGMLLCHKPQLDRIRTTTYFLTPGWIEGEKSLEVEYAQIIEKYGEKRAKMIYDMMFKNYKELMMIDTGAYKLEDWMERVEKISKIVGLDVVVDEGDITALEKLITEDWDEDFCIIPPQRETVHDDFFAPPVEEKIS